MQGPLLGNGKIRGIFVLSARLQRFPEFEPFALKAFWFVLCPEHLSHSAGTECVFVLNTWHDEVKSQTIFLMIIGMHFSVAQSKTNHSSNVFDRTYSNQSTNNVSEIPPDCVPEDDFIMVAVTQTISRQTFLGQTYFFHSHRWEIKHLCLNPGPTEVSDPNPNPLI